MKRSVIYIVNILLAIFILASGCKNKTVEPDSDINTKKVSDSIVYKDSIIDSEPNLKPYKKDVIATYYADKFNNRKTSNGERFSNTKYTAAHRTLPFGTMLRITNEVNNKQVDVRINDRGPYSPKKEIDLTKKAFMELTHNKDKGLLKVTIEIIEE